MIISLSDELNKRAGTPRYDVGLQSYHPGQLEIELLGTHIKISNDTTTLLAAPKTEIRADELTASREGLNYFRHLLLSVTEQMRDRGDAQIAGPSTHHRHQKISDYLRPLFSVKANSEYFELVRKISAADIPVPHDYLVMLPDADARSPSRDDIIRALVPFKKAQRAALQSGWDDGTTALRISHRDMQPTSLILH